MKKSILFLLISASVLVAGCGSQTVAPSLRARVVCAQERMYILEEIIFNVNVPVEQKQEIKMPASCGGKVYKMPEWFVEELARMEKNKVVYVPGEQKTFSEVDLWRQAFANVWTYLERAQQSGNGDAPF